MLLDGTRVGRAWRGWHRRIVDDRSYKNFRVPGRRRIDVLRASVGFRSSRGPSAGTCKVEMQPPTRGFIHEVLAGEKGPRRDVVLLNAGASLFVGGEAASVARASNGPPRRSISVPRTKLEVMVAASHAGPNDALMGRSRHTEANRAEAAMTSTVTARTCLPQSLRQRGVGSTCGRACPARWGGASSRRASNLDRALQGRRCRDRRVNVIAECKRRSPSRGVLRADYDPAAIARRYEPAEPPRSPC